MEDGALGNLAAAGDREESASHQVDSVFMGCAHPLDLVLIPSERKSKIMGTRIENDWNHGLDEKLSLVKGVTGLDCGGWGLGQSGGPWAPGGKCFAPFYDFNVS